MKELKLSDDCRLTFHRAMSGEVEVDLQHLEHSSSHWHEPMVTETAIDKDRALEIIAFLEDAFDLTTYF